MHDHFELVANVMRQSIEKAVLVAKGEIEIARAALGDSAGVVGAASLVVTGLKDFKASRRSSSET